MITYSVVRVVFNIALMVGVFFLPWWIVFSLVIIAIIIFPWYLEAVFFGLYFDVFFGYPALDWYRSILHTTLFVVPLIIAEFLKPRINYGKF